MALSEVESHETEPQGGNLESRLKAQVEAGKAEVHQKAIEDAERAKAAERMRIMGLGGIFLVLCGIAWWRLTTTSIMPNLASEFAEVIPATEITVAEELTWAATMPAEWEGHTSPGAAAEACQALLNHLSPVPDGVTRIELRSTSGDVVASCAPESPKKWLEALIKANPATGADDDGGL